MKVKNTYKHPLTGSKLVDDAKILESYPLKEPFSYAKIVEENGMRRYYIIEPILNEKELKIYHDVIHALEYEINIPRDKVDPDDYLDQLLDKVIKIFGLAKKNVSLDNIRYYAKRDLVGLGALEPLILDPNIEDISVNGLNKPVYIWHRRYEGLSTNLIFDDPRLLDENIIRLVHLGKKHISTANPIVDAALPGGHRLHATFKQEISPHGSSITIRKFREKPITIIDLINYGTINYIIAAYCWLLMEHRATAMVIGSTGSGKTTTLNALLSLIPSDAKIITIEEVKEINIYHDNWVPLLVRESYFGEGNNIPAFRLVKAAMRMRPDILVIGEVRGEEAYALFQAISTGHGGMFTIHAEDTNSALQRMISKPMDVAPTYIQFLDLAFVIRRVKVKDKLVRRIVSIDEIQDIKNVYRLFEWDAKDDSFMMRKLNDSIKIRRIAEEKGVAISSIVEEVARRIKILYWLNINGIHDFRDITKSLQYYRNNPEKFEGKVMEYFKEKGIEIEEEIINMFKDSISKSMKLDLQRISK